MKNSQKNRLLALLKDGKPHSTVEICEKVYGGSYLRLARVGARIYDLKQLGHDIKGWQVGNAFFYQLLNAPKPQQVRYVEINGVRTAQLF